MMDHLHAFLSMLLLSLQDVLEISCPQLCLWLRASPLLLFSSSQPNRTPSARKPRPCKSLLGEFPSSALSSCAEEPAETALPSQCQPTCKDFSRTEHEI